MTGLLEQFLQFFTVSHIMVIIYVLNALIALGLIFFDDSKSPSATMAWIMVLFMVPAVGLFLYMIFSQHIARQQIFKMTEDEQEGKNTLIKLQKEAVRQSMADINLSRPYTQDDRDRISKSERAAESISRLLTEIL